MHRPGPSENGANENQLATVRPGQQSLRDPYLTGGQYPHGQSIEPPGFASTLKEYLRIFNRRRSLVLGILTAVVALGALKTLMTTPMYTSTIRIQIDRNVSKVVEQGNVTPVEGVDVEFLKTQYELLQSRNMAERVVASTHLADDPSYLKLSETSLLKSIMGFFKPQAATTAREKADINRDAALAVMENRQVRPLAGSRLVDVSYTDANPTRAQKITNAFGEAVIASTLDKRFEANSYAKTFLEDQLSQLKLRLQDSEKTLLDFAEKEQIIIVSDKSSMAEADLSNATNALANIVTERIKNEQLWKQAEAVDIASQNQILSSAALDNLRKTRNELVAEYQQKLQIFKPSYPAMVQITNKMAELDRQIATEVKTARNVLKAAYETSLSQENETRARISTVKEEVLNLQKRSIQYNILKREVDTNRDLYNGLLQRFKEVGVAGGAEANNIFIVDRAELPQFPSSPKILQSLLLSVVFGLGLGLGAAYVIESLDDVIVSIEEVERIANLATLGIIPLAAKEVTAELELADPRSALSEAYRSLCTSLQFTTDKGLPKTLAITSSSPGEGKSLTSIAIAQHFARMGLKVLLIDADMRNPSLHKKLDQANGTGLSNYLTGACTPPEAFQKTALPNLAFMPSGPLPPNAADLLGGARLMSLLTIGREVFDFVVIDGPPVLGLADAPLLSNATEATMIVIGAGIAKKASVRGALRRLEVSNGQVIGTVLTRFDARSAGYGYGYGYGYGSYQYSYGQTPPPAIKVDPSPLLTQHTEQEQ